MKVHMIVIKLNERLQQAGHTLYWLAQRSGVPYVTLWNLSKVTTQKSINLPVLSRVCAALDCQPGDLLFYQPDSEIEEASVGVENKTAKRKGARKK